jgi:hypothetical protein
MSAEQKIWITRYLSEEGRLERLIKLYFKVRLSSIEAEDENSFWERFSDTLEERGLLPIGEDIPGNQINRLMCYWSNSLSLYSATMIWLFW